MKDKIWEKFKEDNVDLWVFAYGSLLWNPGFEVLESVPSVLPGYHRSFCMWSVHYRGTSENPGLVLALEKRNGEHCRGLALRCKREDKLKVLTYLRARELISYAYIEGTDKVRLDDGRETTSLLYVVNTRHPQYAGQLSLEKQAEIISQAKGLVGLNSDYLKKTVDRLEQLGLVDASLVTLNQMVINHLGQTEG